VTAGRTGESPIYRHVNFKDSMLNRVVDEDGNEITTLWESFLHGKKIAGDDACFLGHRPIVSGTAGDYEWMTYGQAHDIIESLAKGYFGLKLAQKGKDGMPKIGFYARNRREWVLCQLACFRCGIIVVPLYDTLGPDAVELL